MAAGLVAGLSAPAAAAAGEPERCPPVPVAPVFSEWGDEDNYMAVDGGTFEDGLRWSTRGSPSVVAEAHPFAIGGTNSTRAARLGDRDGVMTGPICLDWTYPHMRFVAWARDPDSRLGVDALWRESDGDRERESLDRLAGEHYTRWRISDKVDLSSILPPRHEVRHVRFRFRVAGGLESWLFDDLWIDPYKR